ncbi:carboxylating nicotinate-nucleotide diphosphorylase [Phycicoccus sp. Soil803]|uniref:carboxylating nicotinate-nucleotide diphosphorylase n=1 Tax=Phycicoccus sp. Soil803 TaxID=1736415 RepID=UPI00070B609B|nr:carboxylating nicotinate-nucleotide diphosphorylase [Phycicoccus sp. Soil803]KRF26227.1 nicotinate-nucleotide pyrophosphorylase [Phycicoccus sp. Soil803]
MTDQAFPETDALTVIRTALDEDLGGPDGVDVTTAATIPVEQVSTAHVVAREGGALAGIPLVAMVFDQVARRIGAEPLQVTTTRSDGDVVAKGDVVAVLEGSTQVTLVGERTMLNLVCRLSGIATHTHRWAERLEGTGATVLDTRKTTPGLRALEKYAVRAGGGTNKRMGLYDVAMIKDNHKLAAGSLSKAYAAVRAQFPDVPVQVEVTTTQEALESVAVGARFLLCDNMSVDLLRETVQAVRATAEHVELEATGGLTLDVARAYAETGVDYLSVGGLTHSSPILDLALDLVD